MKRFKVYQGSKVVDEVYYNDNFTTDEAKASLVDHDGYDESIRVTTTRQSRVTKDAMILEHITEHMTNYEKPLHVAVFEQFNYMHDTRVKLNLGNIVDDFVFGGSLLVCDGDIEDFLNSLNVRYRKSDSLLQVYSNVLYGSFRKLYYKGKKEIASL